MNNQGISNEILESSILIVDDNVANVDLLREILLQQGFGQIVGVTDPRKVEALCREQRFDILLLDIRMPHISGFELMERLRPTFGDQHVPILILTAQIDQETRRRSLELGATDFLTKPFIAWELLQRVRNMLQIRILHRKLLDHNQRLEEVVAERTRELTEALAASRAADRAKLDFLAVMSHELRTPLNSIIGFAEVMNNAHLGPLGHPEYHEYSLLIEESGRHLLNLVNRILDFTRGSTGTIQLDETPVDLRGVAGFAIAMLGPKAAEKNVSVALIDGMSLVIRADERRLRDMLLSLLDNAIKFNHRGGEVVVTIDPLPAEEMIRIAVTDEGPGIAPEIRDRVFDPFIQGDGSLVRRNEGIGLGLSIVKRSAELHGGRVQLQSELQRGTTVQILLPTSRLVRMDRIGNL
jgi:signal transduction histidine kinase